MTFMPSNAEKLTVEDFAKLLGESAADIPEACKTVIDSNNFDYQKLDFAEHETLFRDVSRRVEEESFSVAGKEKQSRWADGWQNILVQFRANNYDPAVLAPHYDRKPAKFVRLNQKFIAPANPMFEMRWLDAYRLWLFETYLKDVKNIYEFGCGTGQNLVALANLFPEKNLYGFEWVDAPMQIIDLLAKHRHLKITAGIFDFFSPDRNLKIKENSAVFTRAALEQIGADFKPFLDFLLEQSPSICVHSEPILELYDPINPLDQLAIKYQTRRNYLKGFLNHLLLLRDLGKIELVKFHRVPFGSLFVEPYSYIVWKPIKNNYE